MTLSDYIDDGDNDDEDEVIRRGMWRWRRERIVGRRRMDKVKRVCSIFGGIITHNYGLPPKGWMTKSDKGRI